MPVAAGKAKLMGMKAKLAQYTNKMKVILIKKIGEVQYHYI